MPTQFYRKNEGFGDLARALVSAPALYGRGRRLGQQQATDRAKDAASIQKSIADARKTNLEAEQLADQSRFRAGLPEDLNVLDAHRSDRMLPVAPPPEGSASSPLEASVNESIRGNQDVFASTAVPSATDASSALANVLRAYSGNVAQVTDAMGNVQSQDLTAEAADTARSSLDDTGLMAALSNIAAGRSMTPFETNASGTVLNRFTGGLDESGRLAGANIDAERALADKRRQSEATLTPQDKQYDALVNLNQAYADAGLPVMPEVTMREIAADHLQTFNDPLGLTRVIYDPARRQVVGTVDEKGYQPFVPDAPAPTGDGQTWGEWLSSWLPGSGGEPASAGPQSSAPPQQSGANPTFFSPIRGETVTQRELEYTAQLHGITVAELKRRLGIE